MKGTHRGHGSSRVLRGKRGFELSIGFIVILIMTIVIFTSSLVLVRKFFVETKNIERTLSTDAQRQIENLIVSGQTIAVVPALVETTRGKGVTSGVGFVNILPEKRTFFVVVVFSNAFGTDESLITDATPEIMDKWVLYNPGPYEVVRGERITIPLRTNPSQQLEGGIRTPDGTYIYNICIFVNNPKAGISAASIEAGIRDGTSYLTKCRDTSHPQRGTPTRTSLGDTLYTRKTYKFTVGVD